jgi:hypothetical protein
MRSFFILFAQILTIPEFSEAQKLSKVKAGHKEPVIKEFPGATLHELKDLNRIENKIDDVMHLSSNPVNGSFTLTFEADRKETVTVTLTDATGKTSFRKEVQAYPGSNHIEIPGLGIHSGVYILSLSMEATEAHRKIIFY